MEAKEFGEFISRMRKEKGMTQAELAAKINVTDKAVSRWERGLGFPDIHTIEPLAEALGISVVELMQSQTREERGSETRITEKDVTEVLNSTAYMTNYYKKRQNTALILIFLFTIMFSTFCLEQANPSIIFLLAACGLIGIGSLCLLVKDWEDEKCRYLYLRQFWVALGTVFIGIIKILPESFIEENMPLMQSTTDWFLLLSDVIVVYQAILNAKKGKLKWRWAIIMIIAMAVLSFWSLYSSYRSFAI